MSALYSSKTIALDKKDTPGWYPAIIFLGIFFGIAFLAAGGTSAVLNIFNNPIRRASKEEAIQNLGTNSRTKWAIRLIPFSKTAEPALFATKIQQLGPPELQYVFVGSYDDLRGYKVRDALQMAGLLLPEENAHVTAIIFRTNSKHIYPANARGVLQVLKEIQKTKLTQADRRIDFLENLTAPGQNRLRVNLDMQDDMASWAWKEYRDFYASFCQVSLEFKCDINPGLNTGYIYSAKRYISIFNDDWHPLGYARVVKSPLCEHISEICSNKQAAKDWDAISKDIRADHFGARIFLINNYRLDELGAMYLIDFDKPESQIIPDIGPLE